MVREQVADELGARDDADDATGVVRLSAEARRVFARERIVTAVEAHAARRMAAGQQPLSIVDEDVLADEVFAAMFGLGPFERYLRREDVEDVCANGFDDVFVHLSDGTKQRVAAVASNNDELVELIRTAAARLGRSERRFDLGHPRLNLRLPD